MPKYKKCPRCELNYILEEQDYCEICKEELRGISHNEEIDEAEDGEICPRCHINFLNEGEKVCEACAAEMEEDKTRVIDEVEPDWDISDEEEVDEADLVDDDVELSVEDLAEEEALENEEDDGYSDDYDLSEDEDDGYTDEEDEE